MPSITFTDEAPRSDTATLPQTLEKGEYELRIKDYEFRTSKAGNEIINLMFEEKESKKYIWDNLVFTPKAQWKIKQFLGAIEKEALDVNADISHMPIHMADVGSDAYDQDLKLGMAASERKRIRDIEDALVRIKKKTYGVCHLTGKAIPDARLKAKPWAKFTKESAEKIERMNRQR